MEHMGQKFKLLETQKKSHNLEKALGGMGKCGKKDRKLELEFLQSCASLRSQSCKGIFEKRK